MNKIKFKILIPVNMTLEISVNTMAKISAMDYDIENKTHCFRNNRKT